jgi:hypothetical protein
MPRGPKRLGDVIGAVESASFSFAPKNGKPAAHPVRGTRCAPCVNYSAKATHG